LGSLPAHLIEAGDHGRLGFHPRCPACRRERLFGAISLDPGISRRVQAALATGVLAFSAAAPAAAIAVEPDRQQEGVVAPEQPGSGADAPDFDPGGETPLPFEVGPSPTTPVTGGGSDDTGEGPPVESEPVDDPDARLLTTEPAPETPAPQSDAPVAPVESAPVTTPPSDSAPVHTTPDTPAVPEPPAAPSAPDAVLQPEIDAKDEEPGRTRRQAGTRGSEQTPSTRSETAPKGPAEAPATTVAPQSPQAASPISAAPTVSTSAPSTAGPAEFVEASAPAQTAPSPVARDMRVHVVQAGESLWSIARKLLGPDASPAQIARQVERLWELNKDRIGTGDPDVLKVGTRLILR
jgi:hypothetical protein